MRTCVTEAHSLEISPRRHTALTRRTASVVMRLKAMLADYPKMVCQDRCFSPGQLELDS